MLLTFCVLAFIQQKSGSLKPLVVQPEENSAWMQIAGKTGVSFSSPVDLGEPKSTGPDLPHTTAETYSPSSWTGTTISASRAPFGKEDPEDSEATKLEDVVYGEIDVEENPVTSIRFSVQEGWPELNLEGKKKDGTAYRYLVCRTKKENFLFSVSGKTLPSQEVLDKMFLSFRLPTETGSGSSTRCGPEPGSFKLNQGAVEVWSPVQLKRSGESLNEGGATGEEFDGEFGYCNYRMVVIKCPDNVLSMINQDALDDVIKQMVDEECEGDKVPSYPIKVTEISGVSYRTAVIRDGTTDGKVAVALKGNTLVMSSAWVPHGMIESEDVKHYFSSIKVK
jgi:hypothetical protein